MPDFINIGMGSLFQYNYHGVAPLPGYSFIIAVYVLLYLGKLADVTSVMIRV